MSPDAAELDGDERATLRRIADYQFGPGAGAALFPDGEPVELHRTGSGRISQVRAGTGRLVSYGVDGRFTLGLAGGRRLRGAVDGYWVAVGAESGPFLREGRNAFAKFVTGADPSIRPRDEVYVLGPPADAGDGNGTDGTRGGTGGGTGGSGPGESLPHPPGDARRPLLAVGRAELPAEGMLAFGSGVAVFVREGAGVASGSDGLDSSDGSDESEGSDDPNA